MADDLTVRVDAAGVLRFIDQADKQRRFAAAVALTRTAQAAQRAVIGEMSRVFDRPTRWALNATRMRSATPQNLSATVWLKDRRGSPQAKEENFLVPQVFGGRRGRKAFETALMKAGLRSNEFVVPAKGAPLDPYGNMPTGVIRQILSQLQSAERSAGYNANVRKGAAQSAQSRRRQAKAGTFFIPRPGGGLPRGIYQRKRLGSGWATRMIFKIVIGRPRYRQRLLIGEIGQRVAAQEFPQHFARAYEQALASAR